MRIEKHKNDCCGCAACASICPRKAITMKPDALGFLYPVVDESLCIDCGRCVKVCSFKNNYDTPFRLDAIKAYAGRHRDLKQVNKSQSGAAFVVLSDYILAQGGVVYGVGYEDKFSPVHKRATTVEERDEFRGSKYVQSDMTGIIPQIKQDLKDGKLVMFTGTACQVSAVSAYFGKSSLRERLFLMDIVCHGVAAPYVWRDYIDFLESNGQKLASVNFRDKRYGGWHYGEETFTYVNGCTQFYHYHFYSLINLRYSCYQCPYTNYKRTSDITVADFWGVEKSCAADLGVDNKGCSLFLVNTDKGVIWFDKAKDTLEYLPVPIEQTSQLHLRVPSVMHKDRAKFENDYATKGFAYVRKKYGEVGINYYKAMFKRKIVKWIYPLAKPILAVLRNK